VLPLRRRGSRETVEIDPRALSGVGPLYPQLKANAACVSPEWIARQMGHANTEMLFRVYSRYVPNLTRRDGSAFENLLAANLSANREVRHG